MLKIYRTLFNPLSTSVPLSRNHSIDLFWKLIDCFDMEETLVVDWLKEIATVSSFRLSEAATGGALYKKLFLKIPQ